MSDRDKMIDYSSKAETLLEENYGASGRGLHEKVSSVKSKIPQSLEKKLRAIASVRNKMMHENNFVLEDKYDFFNFCEDAIRELSSTLSVKPSPTSWNRSRTTSSVKPIPTSLNEARTTPSVQSRLIPPEVVIEDITKTTDKPQKAGIISNIVKWTLSISKNIYIYLFVPYKNISKKNEIQKTTGVVVGSLSIPFLALILYFFLGFEKLEHYMTDSKFWMISYPGLSLVILGGIHFAGGKRLVSFLGKIIILGIYLIPYVVFLNKVPGFALSNVIFYFSIGGTFVGTLGLFLMLRFFFGDSEE